MRHGHEEGVVIAANSLVEGGELLGRQMPYMLVANLEKNVFCNGSQESVQLDSRTLVLFEHVGILDGRR
jgi:hypothetical protein